VCPPSKSTGRPVQALPLLNLRIREEFKNATRALLVTNYEQAKHFASAFDLFWQAWTTDEQLAHIENMQKTPPTDGVSELHGQVRERISEAGAEADTQNEPKSKTHLAQTGRYMWYSSRPGLGA
jgi:uncharacterized protein with von Willebrand factor type A (vWA) domain